MDNELNEILYKFTPKYSIKDYMELHKITNKNVYILIRVCAVIFFIISILKNDFQYKSITEISIIFILNFMIFIFLYNLPNIMAYRMKKVYITSEEHTIILYFYKNYFKVENRSKESYTEKTIYYSKIEKIYITKRNIILKSKEPINYVLVSKCNFKNENIEKFYNFINESTSKIIK